MIGPRTFKNKPTTTTKANKIRTYLVVQRHPHAGDLRADDAQRLLPWGLMVRGGEGRPDERVAVPAREGDEEGCVVGGPGGWVVWVCTGGGEQGPCV